MFIQECVKINIQIHMFLTRTVFDNVKVISGHLVLVLNGHSGIVTSLSVHPHKPYQLISASMDGTIKIWAVDDGVLMKNISMGGVHIYGLKGTYPNRAQNNEKKSCSKNVFSNSFFGPNSKLI